MRYTNPSFNVELKSSAPSFAECVAMFKRGEPSKSPEYKRILAEAEEKAQARAAARQKYLAERENERRVAQKEGADLSWQKAVLGDKAQSSERALNLASASELCDKRREQRERKIDAKLERMRFESRLKAESDEMARQARADFLVLRRVLALM